MPSTPQTFENHGRIVPSYHYVTFGLVAVNLVWSLYRVAVAFSVDTVMALVVALAILMVFFFARLFAVRVQDRVIRLEMRLRLAQLAPDLSARFADLTMNQLCSLRFAGDAELPELARRVVAEGLDDRKAIKKLIRNWQADLFRA